MGRLLDLAREDESLSPGEYASEGVKKAAGGVRNATVGAGTLLGNVLRQISRPGYASTTALHDIVAKSPQEPNFLKNVIRKTGAGLEGYRKGFLLDEPRSFYDLINKMQEVKAPAEATPKPIKYLEDRLFELAFPGTAMAPKESRKDISKLLSETAESEAGKRVLGFTGDVATDPLNIFAPQIYKGVGKLGGALKRGIGTPLAKTRIGQVIGGMFSKNFALKTKFPKVAEEAAQLDDLLRFEQVKSIDEAKRIVKLIPNKEERKLITTILENPTSDDSVMALSKAGKKVLGWLERRRKATEAGVVGREMIDEDRLIDFYVRHAKTDKPGFLGTIKNAITESLPKFLRRRKISGSVKSINEKLGKPFFEDDIALIHGISNTETRKAFVSHDYLRKLADNPAISEPLEDLLTKSGKAVKGIPKPGFTTIKHPLFEGKQVPEEIAQHVASIRKLTLNDESLNAFWRTHDKMLNFWKGQVLISPSYHFRNMVGNTWNNWLMGIDNPGPYLKAGKLQMATRGGVKKLNSITYRLGGKQYRGKQLVDLAKKNGVLDEGFFGADIPESVMQQMQGLSWNPTKFSFRGYHPIKFNREIGTVVENNARLAHFIHRLDKGDDAAKAALSTKKYLFDYSDLAPTEKEAFKRAIPFYTWTRKNIPLQLSNIALQPGKYAKLEKGLRAIQLNDEKAIGGMPDWMSEKFGMPIFRKENDVFAMVFENYIPAMDINKLARPDELYNMATPFLKTPAEIALNKSFYFKRPLEEYEGQKVPWGRLDMNINLEDAEKHLGGIPFGSQVGSAVKEGFRKVPLGRDVSAKPTQPILSQVRVLNEINKIAQNYDDWTEYVKFITGGKLYKYNPETQKIYKHMQKTRKVADLIGFLTLVSKRGVLSSQKSKKEFAKREAKNIKHQINKVYGIENKVEEGGLLKNAREEGLIK